MSKLNYAIVYNQSLSGAGLQRGVRLHRPARRGAEVQEECPGGGERGHDLVQPGTNTDTHCHCSVLGQVVVLWAAR